MSQSRTDLWTAPQSSPASQRAADRIRRRFPAEAGSLSPGRSRLLAAVVAGALLGSGATALAGLVPRVAGDEQAPVVREPVGQALDLEWRSYRTPVDVSRMFRGR